MITHYHQEDLARRWRMAGRTLERWRYERIGPPFLKIGGRVIYRLADIEAFEETHRQLCFGSEGFDPRNPPGSPECRG